MKFLAVLLLVSTFLSSCLNPIDDSRRIESVLEDSRASVAKLLMGDSSCTAFHVGHELFITAAHCFTHGEVAVAVDLNDLSYPVTPVLIDRDRDVAVFRSEGFPHPPLRLWNEVLYGKPKIGSAIVSLGFPGYYMQNFVFESGAVLDLLPIENVDMIISRGVSYPGESGGPVISLKNGQVVGLVHAISEQTMVVNNGAEVHNSLSLLIAWSEIKTVLEQARKLN